MTVRRGFLGGGGGKSGWISTKGYNGRGGTTDRQPAIYFWGSNTNSGAVLTSKRSAPSCSPDFVNTK
jgi:hypothetical protein